MLFLAQPNPLPEMLIRQTVAYLTTRWRAGRANLSVSIRGARRIPITATPSTSVTCNDYRAGQTYDEGRRGRSREAQDRLPTLSCGACGSGVKRGGVDIESDDPLKTWGAWCENLRGGAVDSGHFVTEENPAQTMSHLLPFLMEFGRP
jgi:haloacetate dehalogenase